MSQLHFGNDFVVKLLLFRQHLDALCNDLDFGQIEHIILTSPQHVIAKVGVENLLILHADYLVTCVATEGREAIYESPVALKVRFSRINSMEQRP